LVVSTHGLAGVLANVRITSFGSVSLTPPVARNAFITSLGERPPRDFFGLAFQSRRHCSCRSAYWARVTSVWAMGS
jgi:hypothetical protein